MSIKTTTENSVIPKTTLINREEIEDFKVEESWLHDNESWNNIVRLHTGIIKGYNV
jgi:hypothetical protein